MLKSNEEGQLPILKIGDYGLSRVYTNEMDSNVGTNLYKAPEVYRREGYNSRCDLYSVGVILYYMVTLQYPFQSNTIPGDIVSQFRHFMEEKKKWFIPKDITVDELLLKLMEGLITHHVSNRMNW